MQLSNIARLCAGSCVVYLLVAACASSDDSATRAYGDAADGGIFDAITHPMKDANAAEADVATEACDKTYASGTGSVAYAEHAYAGRSKSDLARVVALMRASTEQASAPPGYQEFTTTVWVGDGKAAVLCSSPSDSVTFVLPTM